MKTIPGLVGLTLLLAWPMRAQEGPPAPPDAPDVAPFEVPVPPPNIHERQGVRRFVPSPMHRMGFGAWWKNSEIVSKLELSDDQLKRIEQAFLNHRLKLVDLRADLEKQELQLGPLLDADQPDEQKVGSQIDQVTLARGRLEKENAMMMLAIRRVLSVDQWKKLQSLREGRRPVPGRIERGPRAEKGFRPPP